MLIINNKMNKKIQLIILMGIAPFAFSQIKEERLVLSKKREPEVKKIVKKHTSVNTDKNYPPKEKKIEDSLNLRYQITDVPAVSDFKTSAIQGADITPKFDNFYLRNFFRAGLGNYGKVLVNANISGKIDEKSEVGADVDFLSTTGLKKDYAWKSSQMDGKFGVYLNHYADKGKANVTANYNILGVNYYGIQNEGNFLGEIPNNIDIKQRINQLSLNGFYDHYSNEILDNVSIKTSFLSDYFKAKESVIDLNANLSKNEISINSDTYMNAGLGLNLISQSSNFKEVNLNHSGIFNFSVTPKLTFHKGISHLTIGSELGFLSENDSGGIYPEAMKKNRFVWFPKAEILFETSSLLKIYAGVDGGLKINSFGNLTAQNPYLLSDQELRPTITKYKIYGGVKGDVNETFKYDINGGFSRLNDAVFFKSNDLIEKNSLNPRRNFDLLNTFSAVYDDATLLEINANGYYYPLQNLSLNGEVKFQQFVLENLPHAYYQPFMQIGFGAKYSVLNQKLHLGFKGYLVGNRTGNRFINQPNLTTDFQTIEDTNYKIGGYTDLNLSAEYRFHKNFSIFALANNLLNAKYQSYNGYKVLGTQILGGLKISF